MQTYFQASSSLIKTTELANLYHLTSLISYMQTAFKSVYVAFAVSFYGMRNLPTEISGCTVTGGLLI